MNDWSPEDLQKSLESGANVFLKLWKKGCGACKLSSPAIERIEAQDQSGLVFSQVCTDEYPEILEIAEVESLPTFFVFVDGRLKGQYTGFKGLEKLKSFVTESLAG